MGADADRSVSRTAIGAVAVIFLLQLWLVFHRALNVDELEHAHATWCLSKGLVPYRDFFEHHTPWLYFALAPLFARFPAETDAAAAYRLLIVCRLAMWAIAAACVLVTAELGRLWRDRATGILAAFLLASSIQFLDVMLELRPDVPGLACWLVSLVCAIRGWRGARASHAFGWFIAGGLAFAAALLFTQKYVFALPGIALMLAGYVLDRSDAIVVRRGARIAIVGAYVLAVCAPIAATARWFIARGAGPAFVDGNVAFNIHQNAQRFSPLPLLISNLVHSPALTMLGVVGFFAAYATHRSGRIGDRLVLFSTAASLIAGLAVFGRVYGQYLVMFFPHLAVFGAAIASDVMRRMGRWLPPRRALSTVLPIVPAAAFAALLVGLDRPASPSGLAMLASFTIAASLASLAIWHRASERGIGSAIVAIAALATMTIGNAARIFHPMAPQIADLTYVIDHTRPDDLFLGSGVTAGAGVFRPHAWRYFFEPSFASDRELADLVDRITTGRLKPRIIAFDDSEGGPPSALRPYIDAHYRWVRDSMYERRD